uniref:Uncharacterized protein n=1 Tax=Arundo donax TaxID=35708 RepID=A0A0A8Y9C6_ARUDO
MFFLFFIYICKLGNMAACTLYSICIVCKVQLSLCIAVRFVTNPGKALRIENQLLVDKKHLSRLSIGSHRYCSRIMLCFSI